MMEAKDKAGFLKMLTKAMAAYGKPLPEASVIAAWIEILTPYAPSVISAAFQAYCDENGEFAPIPAGIAKRCKLMDGRPGAEEAWAIALTSRDEAATVVWTQETASAFGICSPVLETGDEVGARMAFKESYNRLVSEARAMGVLVKWSASLGWDLSQRQTVLTNASNIGLLPAPYVAGLLPAPVSEPEVNSNAREQLQQIREMLAASNEEKARRLEEAAQRERDAVANAKKRLQQMTENYKKDDALLVEQIEQEQVRRAADGEY